MFRTFDTHKIRKCVELTGKTWSFTPCQGEYAGNTYQIVTPCCIESHPLFTNYRGEGIYRTTFHASGNIRIEFKGISHTASIALDGQKIANHYNAYTIFSVVINDLKDGEHILEITSNNLFSKESALHIPNDYMSYGGITRPVILENINDIYIKYIHVTPYIQDNIWHTKLNLTVENITNSNKAFDSKIMIDGKVLFYPVLLLLMVKL